jgi:hypothetical protein
MLRPDGADLFVRRKLSLRGFGQRSIEIGGFLRREFVGWLVHASELQQNSREIVLRLIRQGGDGFNGLFEQTGHPANIVTSASLWKPCRQPHGFPISIAIAAARNGNGTETAARNQTNLAGMNGISHKIMRWKANSAQATT